MTDNQQNFNSLQERNQQVLSDISQLQDQEKQLYDSLDDVTLSSEQKQQIITKINEISQIRLNVYAGLKDMYSFYQKDVSASRGTLGQEMSALEIMENELNEAKRRLNKIQDEKRNKLRLVEINTYYGKRYNAHSKIMKTIVLVCIPLIILAVLANSGLLPPTIYMLLAGIVILIGIVILGYQLVDLSNRSNMNWDEYNWYFNPESVETSTTTTPATNPWATPSLTCVGSQCCYEGSTYDETQNICIPNPLYKQQATTTDTTTSTDTTTDTTTTTTDPATAEGFKSMSRYGYQQIKPTPINSYVMPSYASLSKF